MNDIFDIDSMTFKSDGMFQSVMKNKDICQMVLELFLGFKLRNLIYPEPEKTYSRGLLRRSIRVDISVEDEEGNIIDIEMQSVDKGDLEKRSRYYQGMIDTSGLKKGNKTYSDLKRCIIIFLCDFNPFDKKKQVYHFRMRDDGENPYTLQDGAERIFACTEGKAENTPVEILSFLSYLKDNQPTNDLTKSIDDQVVSLKNDAEWRKNMWENHAREWDLLAEGRAEGRAEGKAEAEASFAREQERLAELIGILKQEGKTELALQAVQDLSLRDRLFQEYGIR